MVAWTWICDQRVTSTWDNRKNTRNGRVNGASDLAAASRSLSRSTSMEDWAETWAHYMNVVDTLGTVISIGVKPELIAMPFDCFGSDPLRLAASGF